MTIKIKHECNEFTLTKDEFIAFKKWKVNKEKSNTLAIEDYRKELQQESMVPGLNNDRLDRKFREYCQSFENTVNIETWIMEVSNE